MAGESNRAAESSRAAQPDRGGTAGSRLTHVFGHGTAGPDWPRAVLFLDVALVPLLALWATGCEQYLPSAFFGLLFAALTSPGGRRQRAFDVGVRTVAGAGVTALAFGIGADSWSRLALAAFVVTLAAGVTAVSGGRRITGASLLSLWFLVAAALASGFQASDLVTSRTWAQVLAWTAGAVLWTAVTFALRHIRGRDERPERPGERFGDAPWGKPARPLLLFAMIRALAVAGTVALAYGLELPHGGWIPVVALIAMTPNPEQTWTVGTQRLTGALIGAGLAAVLLLMPPGEHGVRLFAVERGLEAVALVLFAHGAAIRSWSRTYCTAAVVAGALVLMDLPQHSGHTADGYRVLWTLCGAATGLFVMWLAGRITGGATAGHDGRPGTEAHGGRPGAEVPSPAAGARAPGEPAHLLPGDRSPADHAATADHGR